MVKWLGLRPLATRAKGPGFDSPITQHVQRLISRAFMFGSDGSLVLSIELVLGLTI